MMLWTLVVLVFVAALAIATAVVARFQVRQLRHAHVEYEERLRKLDTDLETQLDRRRKSDLAASELADRVTRLEMNREDAASGAEQASTAGGSQVPAPVDEQMAERLRQALATVAGWRRWANSHFTAAGAGPANAPQLEELERYVVRSLEHEAGSVSAGPRILRCGLHAAQPSVLDIGPLLLDELHEALDADLMYRLADGPNGIKSYVRWPGGPAPRLRLDSMLRTAVTPVGNLTAEVGAGQLQALLHVLDDGGPSALQLGPLLVIRTRTGMSAGYVPADWPGLSPAQVKAVIAGTTPDLLARLGASEAVNLTGWSETAAA